MGIWSRDMSEAFLTHLRSTLAEIDAAGPDQARAADRRAAGRRASASPPTARRARWSTSAPTITSASPTIPRSSPPPRRRSTNSASAWPRCASSAARRRCTASSSRRIAAHLGKDDAILFAACFDANGGVFEPLLGEEDAIISDCAQPRLDHRRRAPVQGAPLPLRQFRHERARGPARSRPTPTARASS